MRLQGTRATAASNRNAMNSGRGYAGSGRRVTIRLTQVDSTSISCPVSLPGSADSSSYTNIDDRQENRQSLATQLTKRFLMYSIHQLRNEYHRTGVTRIPGILSGDVCASIVEKVDKLARRQLIS